MMDTKDDDDCDFKEITQSNYTKISSTLSKLGYTEGITEGRESVFQIGFDQGYADGLKTGFAIAKFKTFANKLPSTIDNENLIIEANKLKCNITDSKNPTHFKLNENSNLPLIKISNIQNKYADEFVNNIQAEFPIINSLLC